MQLNGKRVVIVGMGASGRSVARICLARGAIVIGVDLRHDVPDYPGVRLELGTHRRATFLAADLIVVSPGVPSDQPDLVAAEAEGVSVIGELGFASALLEPHNPVYIGVTGTNGKSTVTAFVGQILKAAGVSAFVGGNLGQCLSEAVPLLSNRNPDWKVPVVECSSYQLERLGGFAPKAGVILNLTPDHLARHKTMDAYGKAKARLFKNVNSADALALVPEALAPLVEGTAATVGHVGALPGLKRIGELVTVRVGEVDVDLSLAGFSIPGEHNKDNAAVAAALALWVGADPAGVQKGLSKLKALAHRMEVVRDDGVTWINDSKATNVDATRVGLSGLASTAVVLLGGKAKGRGFRVLAGDLRKHRAVVTFGSSGPASADELEA
ncbi:MAG: UDP-N-acetylmuramoyl-L-alanine--D-glutamate ligase, partial [Myxococcota bacterium]